MGFIKLGIFTLLLPESLIFAPIGRWGSWAVVAPVATFFELRPGTGLPSIAGLLILLVRKTNKPSSGTLYGGRAGENVSVSSWPGNRRGF